MYRAMMYESLLNQLYKSLFSYLIIDLSLKWKQVDYDEDGWKRNRGWGIAYLIQEQNRMWPL